MPGHAQERRPQAMIHEGVMASADTPRSRSEWIRDNIRAVEPEIVDTFGQGPDDVAGLIAQTDPSEGSGPAHDGFEGAMGPVDDDPFPAAPVKADEAQDPLLRRPDGFHPVLAWPPQWLADAVRRAQADKAARRALEQEIAKRVGFVARRVDAVDRYFTGHKVRQRKMSRRLQEHLREQGHDDRAIAAAAVTTIGALISSPDAPSRQFLQNSAFWSRDRVLTRDGAIVRYAVDSVETNKVTRNAAALLLEEARSRGWSEVHVSGPAAFRKMVMDEAREMDFPLPVVERTMKKSLRDTFFKKGSPRRWATGPVGFQDAVSPPKGASAAPASSSAGGPSPDP